MKRYQYSRAGFSPPTSTRQVQSDAALTPGLRSCATTRRKARPRRPRRSERCRVACRSNGRRVQRMTLVGSGSPEATPSGKRSRRSFQVVCDARAGPREGERGAHRCGAMDELTAAERHALLVHIRLRVFHLGQPWFARRIAVALELQRAKRGHQMLPTGIHHRTYTRCPEKLGKPTYVRRSRRIH